MVELAERNLKRILKPGDRVGCVKCPGTKRVITFAGWDGHWMVSASGVNDYSPGHVYSINGHEVDPLLLNRRLEP